MTKCDVTNFVGHHSGHLTFVPCSLNHSAIHIHWTTRQSEGVYVTRINNFKVVSEFGMLELTGYSTDQTVANSGDITAYCLVIQQRKLLFSFLSSLTAQLYVILWTVLITVIFDLGLCDS